MKTKMSEGELVKALIRIADVGIVHFSEADILRDAAETIELLAERVAIMEETPERKYAAEDAEK